MSVNEKMTSITDAIRDKTGGVEKLSLDDMAVEIPKVYEAGKKAEYDAFWDAYQQSGERTDYQQAFAGKGWNDETYKPKYPLKPIASGANSMYQGSLISKVEADFSECTELYQTFRNSGVKEITILDMAKARTSNNYAVGSCSNLHTIGKLIVSETTAFVSNTFQSCSKLVNLVVEGVSAKAGFSLQWSTLLSKASIESVINALSSTTTDLTVTLPKTAVNNAFGIDVDDVSTYPEGSEYYELRQSKSNWKISYS